jgi:hypothetical protein
LKRCELKCSRWQSDTPAGQVRKTVGPGIPAWSPVADLENTG